MNLDARHHEIRPDDIAPPAANYAHAMLSEGTTKWLHTSGVLPIAADGTVPNDIGAQADLVWQNIAAILRDAHMGPEHIVSVTTYVVAGEPLGPVMAARDGALDGRRVASTLLTVPALAQDVWRMEVAVIAAS